MGKWIKNSADTSVAIAIVLAMIAGLMVGVYGWIMNIAHLLGMTGFSGLLVGRVVGIFIPIIGAVLGYIG